MSQEFYQKLEKLLKKDKRFLDQEGDLLKSNIIDLAFKADKQLIELLLSQAEFKSKFFSKIKDVFVFNINNFVAYIQDKNFLADSYTKYQNKIGLNIDGKFLKERDEVALVWPFKDCVLEGGMIREDEKRKEIFFNEILAQDEIDKLFSPKVLINWKKYSEKGEAKVKDLKRDKNRTIRENLIIKGNNLLALHCLKQQFQNNIKLIYIDPPYNTGNDSFGYNDNFKHATWLTFMKNRLEVAWEMLRDDGVIFVSVNHLELGYILILMDEIFKRNNKLPIITLRAGTTASYRSINECPVNVTEYVIAYSKTDKYKGNEIYNETGYTEDYSHFIGNKKSSPGSWKLENINEIIYKKHGFKDWQDFKRKYGTSWKRVRFGLKEQFAIRNADKVVSLNTLQKPSESIRQVIEKSSLSRNKVFICRRQDKGDIFCFNGRTLAFFSSKFKVINKENVPCEIMTNLWTDVSFLGIGPEGDVDLTNGKKPELLIKKIIELAIKKDDDIILDFFVGSGTTTAVAHKMGKQYIGIEQLDYGENDSVNRLQNVIKGDQSGVSKEINWKGGGTFVYCELMKYNELFVDKIRKAKVTKELLRIWEEMKEKSFLDYNIDIKKFDETIDEYKKLSLAKQKHILLYFLNKNQLYVNLSEIEDKELKIKEIDKLLNKEFYC